MNNPAPKPSVPYKPTFKDRLTDVAAMAVAIPLLPVVILVYLGIGLKRKLMGQPAISGEFHG